jgi:O-6-methylguanine DNA methyltransferase
MAGIASLPGCLDNYRRAFGAYDDDGQNDRVGGDEEPRRDDPSSGDFARRVQDHARQRDGGGFLWLARTSHRIVEYLNGARREFDLPLDLRGTEFQRRVWATVAGIPYGETRTYADIARAIGKPKAVRAVGAANGANPLPLVVPCHRVLGSDGSLTGYGGGLDVKRQLLEMESQS